MPKRIVFLTGTRADFGKIKSLIQVIENDANFESHVFVTGMHMLEEYGYTLIEVQRCGYKNIETFNNHTDEATMDLTLGKTIQGFSSFINKIKPDLIVVHGDRVEALAGAIVGSLNNILVAHIEGGEVTGTIDELIRHSTSKMSHIHFVANELAKKRLIQMGELPHSIEIIGSPDLDIMFSNVLPSLDVVKQYYEIDFESYALAMYHPVTTEIESIKEHIDNFIEALTQSNKNYVLIYPNNDLGSKTIIEAYQKLKNNRNVRIFPSIRFEYFLTLLKNSEFIIGNSSAGIREAPAYNIPTINIGTRQENRTTNNQIVNVNYNAKEIVDAIFKMPKTINNTVLDYGNGNSAQHFFSFLNSERCWSINHQKQFKDS
ncbi:UDP-N-acetylglucosamine 2-epimerase [Flavivirga eckloniae]|uniref:UDP-N-acetylglucosamine 2-epimerase (Hydrolyzing) n=1 Tax=Flavivirga eckloniae TaxID=1803846 RepID=A0A2K9PM75_9FLAO|nr:UDP-N-acetylglucosamine 2-epimerase [Flavivirga eckloniae]AUP78171.1 UDP-N-acetylglucosamine 2-epimerase (hydrolyzing) [Flavivirga eckloniae]